MKWGVRRYQNVNGTYTAAGLKRYKKDQKQYKKEQAKYDEDRLKAANQKSKSKRVQTLEAKYKSQGMTDEEAAVAAYRRARTEKILAVALGTAVVVGASYGAYKLYKHNVDQTIRSGSTLQNISTNSSKGVADAFYASTNSKDNATYRGLYGETLHQRGGTVYETKIKALKDLRVASPKNAEREFANLMAKDKDFKKYVNDLAVSAQFQGGSPGQLKVAQKAYKSLQRGKIDKNVYEMFNINGMVYNSASPKANQMRQRFMDALKSKGYDAVGDVNDRKYSGYGTKNPLIILDNSTKLRVFTRRAVGDAELNRAYNSAYTKLVRKASAKAVASTLAKGAAGIAVGGTIVSKINERSTNARRQQVVNAYKQEHPNSKLSDKQILDIFYE